MTTTEHIIKLTEAHTEAHQDLLNFSQTLEQRVAAKEKEVDDFIAGAKNQFRRSASQMGILEDASGVKSMRVPSLSAGEDGATVHIVDKWRTDHWGYRLKSLIHTYGTYYEGAYALYHWNGETIELMQETQSGYHPTFTITDHGKQTDTGHSDGATYRFSLNMVLPAYQNGFCIIQTLSNTRTFGNDEPGTTDTNFGNDGSALVFQTMTNAQVSGA